MNRVSFAALILALTLAITPCLAGAAKAEGRTMTISAEGLADPKADTYKRDKGLLLEDLRKDAKSRILEKAVGTFVESQTLMQNYAIVHDSVFSKSQGLIKRVVKESPSWEGEDGFAHLLMTAEVYISDVGDALKEMSRGSRVALIRDYGNPRISVSINIRDAERGVDIKPERSEVAENILKERIKSFGYRVWSEDLTSRVKGEVTQRSAGPGQSEMISTVENSKQADFAIRGEAKFKTVSAKLAASGLEVKKFVLTSWSVKCVDNHTGEEIYFNNAIPKKQSWPDEDQALEEIGRMIGQEFNKEFFTEHLQAPSKTYQLQVVGLPSFDAAQLVRKEFLGLRNVLAVDLRDFDRNGISLYEVEFAGDRGNFNQFLVSAILAPLNAKLREEAFALDSAHGSSVRVSYRSKLAASDFMDRFKNTPPASLEEASPQRLKELVKSEDTAKKLAETAPEVAKKLASADQPAPATSTMDAVKGF